MSERVTPLRRNLADIAGNRDLITFKLWGRVLDLAALYAAAHAHALTKGYTEAEARASLTLTDAKDENIATVKPSLVDASACVQMLLDPGSIPGFEIEDSESHKLTIAKERAAR